MPIRKQHISKMGFPQAWVVLRFFFSRFQRFLDSAERNGNWWWPCDHEREPVSVCELREVFLGFQHQKQYVWSFFSTLKWHPDFRSRFTSTYPQELIGTSSFSLICSTKCDYELIPDAITFNDGVCMPLDTPRNPCSRKWYSWLRPWLPNPCHWHC